MINLNLETQNFTVMHQTPAFEIRHYPAYTTAKINAQLKSFRELGNSGYSILAKYIFGDIGPFKILLPHFKGIRWPML